MNRPILASICASIFTLFASCSSESKPELKVVASATPHAQMLEFIQPELKAQGIHLVIIVTDDYNMPNRALANGEIDVNFFQHTPFLNEQIKQFHYPIESIATIELEPMGVYSKKIHTLQELQERAKIAIPNDPTNEARALLLLQKHQLVELDDPNNVQATVLNIRKNPKQLQFIEVDAAMLPRTLDDVDLAIINTNYALGAELIPLKDALILEDKDSPYANVLVVRTADANRADIQALKQALTSDKMRAFILEKYHGSILPAF